MKKTLLIIIVVAIILCLTFFLVFNKSKEENYNFNTTPETTTQTSIVNDSYTINVLEDGGQYILDVILNTGTNDFSFSYDDTLFLLDSSDAIFDNAVKGTDGSYVSYTLSLVPNKAYNIYFIPRVDNAKLELNKNIKIN